MLTTWRIDLSGRRVVRRIAEATGVLLSLGCGSGGPALTPPPAPPPPPPVSPPPSPPSPPSPPPPPPTPPPANVVANITIDTMTRFQVMTGWEAHAQSGNRFPGFAGWQASLMDLAVDNLGINRLRLEIRAGMEHSVDYHTMWRAGTLSDAAYKAGWYVPINDNADPNSINQAGFQWSGLDWFVDEVVVPMRQRLQARGEQLYLNLNYVAFASGGALQINNPAEYAELILAAFEHLRDKYGFVPDAVEVILEPDNATLFRGPSIGRAIAATGARLAAAGFRPEFIAPSVTNAANAVPWLNEIVQEPGALTYLKTVSYHRYSGVSDATLTSIAARARQLGLQTAMLEHIGSGVEDLYDDLTLGQVSAWQQFALAFGTVDNGGTYFLLPGGVPILASRSVKLRQYFKYVRFGAQRVAAASDQATVRPVGFRDVGGGPVVVVHTTISGNIGVSRLRPGRYGVSFAGTTDSDLADVTAGADGVTYVTPPSAGILTLYFKS